MVYSVLTLLFYCALTIGLSASCSTDAFYDYIYCVSSDSACSQCLPCYNNATLYVPSETRHARLCNDPNELCDACKTHCTPRCESTSLPRLCPSLPPIITTATHIELRQNGNRSAVDFEYRCVADDQRLRIKYAILSPISLTNVSPAYLDQCTLDFSSLLASECDRSQCVDVNLLSTLGALAASCALSPAMFKSQVGVYCVHAEPPTYNIDAFTAIESDVESHNSIPLSDAVLISLLSLGAFALLLLFTGLVWLACKHCRRSTTDTALTAGGKEESIPAPTTFEPGGYELPRVLPSFSPFNNNSNKRQYSHSEANVSQAIPTTHEFTHTRDASELIGGTPVLEMGELGLRAPSLQARDHLKAWNWKKDMRHMSPQSASASHNNEYDISQPDLAAIQRNNLNVSHRSPQMNAVHAVQQTERDILSNTLMYPNDGYFPQPQPYPNYAAQQQPYFGPPRVPHASVYTGTGPGYGSPLTHVHQHPQQQQQYANAETVTHINVTFPDLANPMGDFLAFGGMPDLYDDSKIEHIAQGDYHFEAEIGGGTCATVFKGRWRGQEVAVKRFNKNIGIDAKAAKRYVDSCALKLCANRHDNVIRFFAYCTEPFTMLTEYMNYGSVKRFVRRSRAGSTSISILERIELGCQAVRGIAHLHSLDIVHTEINCQNLLMEYKPDLSVRVVLTDFGIPQVLSKEAAETYRASLANIKWLAPECIDPGIEHEQKTMHYYTKEADVYAFGITLWEIITGQDPYPDINPVDTAVHVYAKERRPQSYAFIPEKIQQVMKHCWHKNKSDRPTAERVVETLFEFIAHERIQNTDDGNNL